ncbi:MAG: response regulator [Desulfobacterales bacterium]|nr:response regulator [Desulfobacterales bacterium]
MSEKELKRHIRKLEERIQYLEEVNRLTWDALEMAGSVGRFKTSIRNLDNVSTILQETRTRVEKLVPFKASAFFLVDETNSQFYLADCKPEEHSQFFRDEVDSLVSNGTFSWALREQRPVIVSSRKQKRLVLHVMTTASRTRGMFIGSLERGEKDIPHISLALLSIVMLNSANMLESFELYKMIKDINVDLEKTVVERTKELTYRVKLENLIATISTTFINLALADIDTGIVHALQVIGKFINADHGYILLLSEDATSVDNGYEWCAEGVGSQIEKFRGLELEDFPLLAERIRKFENLHIPSVAELPLAAKADSGLLELLRIESLIVVPMVSGNAVVGLLGFDWVSEGKSWTDETVALIKIVGEIFINALQRKRAEQEKKELETKLQHAQKLEAIGTLAGGIAHDFNNLLMAIQGNASLVLFDIDPTHPFYEFLTNIKNQVESGAKLTRQLLGYARKGRYYVQPININELVENTSEAFGRTRKEIIIHRELTGDLFAIEADQSQIEQVLMNLFVNAADAMPVGGNVVLKTMNATHKDMKGKLYDPKPGNYVQLTVTDTGKGMDKETLERIFEPFFTTKEMGRGTGLGLASVYGIIKGHGGYIDVESEPGRGTTFSIYLPATEEKVEKTVKPTEEIVEGAGTILLVDDEDRIMDVGTKLLKRLGYTVLEARGGREAVEIYKDNKDKIDLVILDMVMPRMGGGEAYDRMKEINPNVKVLLSSGYSIESQAKEILARGCDAFIQKPFGMQDLSVRIREILDKKRILNS